LTEAISSTHNSGKAKRVRNSHFNSTIPNFNKICEMAPHGVHGKVTLRPYVKYDVIKMQGTTIKIT
jgi:hypothetical protein